MTSEQGAGALPNQEAQGTAEGVYLEAHASDDARVIQAGRDLHIRHEMEGVGTRRVQGAEVVEECPYPGLAAFGPEDARWFFGRDALLAELTGLLSAQPSCQGPVLLVAPSGAGKSSLLHAGLIPALNRGVLPQPGSRRWPRLLFTPTAHPLAALASQLSAVTGIPPDHVSEALTEAPGRAADLVREAMSAGRVPGGTVVVVDQFEETFALCEDEKERAVFVEALCALESAGGLVVLSLRADFYLQACAYPMLRAALRDRQILMGPMSAGELRRAIVYPSHMAGLELEPGLIELLIRDLGGIPGSSSGPAGASGYDAGRLPLLAHALRATWQQRHGHLLTVDGYLTTGGIPHAIAASAERTFGRLTTVEQELARLLFLRMVRIGDRADDTRRQVAHAELVQGSGSPANVEAVIEAFTQARLLTREREAVEITHEALLREWPRLRGWIDTDRADRLVQQDIEEQATGWETAGRDPSLLYRGTRLAAASTWAARPSSRGELTARAQAFIDASVRQKRRVTRRRQGAFAALTVLTLGASVLAGVAVVQRQDAIRERDQANFNEVNAEAASLSRTNPSLAAQLSLVAYRMKQTPDLYTSLVDTEAQGLATPLALGAQTFTHLTYGPGGRILAGAGGRTIRLWNTTDQERPVPLGAPLAGIPANVNSVTISPDGRILAAGLSNGTARMWNITDPAHPVSIGEPLHVPGAHGTSAWATFDPRGHILFTSVNGVLQLWNVGDPAKPAYLSSLAPCSVESWALSPDGDHAGIGCQSGKAYLADISDPAHPRFQGTLAASSDGEPVTTLVFSPDSRTLMTAAYSDQTFTLWNVTNPWKPALLAAPESGLENGVESASFSPDGSLLAIADHDGTIQLYNAAVPADTDPASQPMRAGASPAFAVAFSPDGRTIASGYLNGSMLLWSVPHLVAASYYNSGYTDGLAFNSNGTLLATTNSQSRVLDLFEITDGSLIRRVGSYTVCPGDSQFDAFAPQGPVLAIGCGDGYFRLWDTADPFHVTALSPPLIAGSPSIYVNTVTFDQGGKILTASDNGKVTLWNAADPAHPTQIGSFSTDDHQKVWTSAAISPDGRTVAVGVGATARLWNVANPASPRTIGAPLPGLSSQFVNDLTFSPDGDLVAAAGDDNNIYLWHASGPHRGTLAATLAGHTDVVNGVAFNPDGDILASVSYDNTVRLWSIAQSGKAGPLGEPLIAHTDYALSVAFSPIGSIMASIGLDDMVYLWDLNVNDAISRICAATSGVLTPAQWRIDVPGVPYNPPCSGNS
jgi:WD40 repeat protein